MASLPEAERSRFLSSLSLQEQSILLYDWTFWARPNQLAPAGDWRVWLALAGRGFGKTRLGAEWVRDQVEHHGAKRIALIARTAADVRDVLVEGESGLLAVCPPWNKPEYEPSKRRITWPNGALATTYSADTPDLLRGPQHDAAWVDELASYQYAQETWDMLMFGLRLGADPRVVVTTTPRPTKLIKDLLVSTTSVVTRGSTYDNRANLAPAFFSDIISKYEGSRLGRQELLAEILEDVQGALWSRGQIDALRVQELPTLKRIVVAIDPAVTSNENSDETGIVVVGRGMDDRAYVLEDLSCKASPDQWCRKAVSAYHRHNADRIICETNNGGDLVRTVLKTVDANVPYKSVRASRGKVARAEPIAALYEQGRIFHNGCFSMLEDQMTSFVPGNLQSSPDRVDALVWGVTELMLGGKEFHREMIRPN